MISWKCSELPSSGFSLSTTWSSQILPLDKDLMTVSGASPNPWFLQPSSMGYPFRSPSSSPSCGFTKIPLTVMPKSGCILWRGLGQGRGIMGYSAPSSGCYEIKIMLHRLAVTWHCLPFFNLWLAQTPKIFFIWSLIKTCLPFLEFVRPYICFFVFN